MRTVLLRNQATVTTSSSTNESTYSDNSSSSSSASSCNRRNEFDETADQDRTATIIACYQQQHWQNLRRNQPLIVSTLEVETPRAHDSHVKESHCLRLLDFITMYLLADMSTDWYTYLNLNYSIGPHASLTRYAPASFYFAYTRRRPTLDDRCYCPTIVDLPSLSTFSGRRFQVLFYFNLVIVSNCSLCRFYFKNYVGNSQLFNYSFQVF